MLFRIALLAGMGFLICFAVSATAVFILRGDSASASSTDSPPPISSTTQRPRTVDQAHIQDEPSAIELPDVSSTENRRERGDNYLLAGNPTRAIDEYRAVLEAQPYETDELRLRLALCYEAMQDYPRAYREYQSIAANAKSNKLGDAAKLGLCRSLLEQNQQFAAKQILWDWLLQSHAAQNRNASAIADVTHLLGHVLVSEVRRHQPAHYLDEQALAFPDLNLAPAELFNRYLHSETHVAEVFVQTNSVGDRSPDNAETTKLIQKFGDDPSSTIFNARVHRQPIAALIEQLTSQADIQAKWSAAARETVSTHFADIHVESMSLAMILDGLLDSLDIEWVASANTIDIHTASELKKESRIQSRLNRCQRVVSHATLTFPNHPNMAQGLVNLGNLAFLTGHTNQAIASYQESLRNSPRSPAAAHANFNLGKLHTLTNRRDDALKAYYFVVDDHLQRPFLPAAYVQIARHYLSDDDPERAVQPAQYAIAKAVDDRTRAAAAMCFASAFLLQKNPYVANRALFEQRLALRKSKFVHAGAMLAAQARYDAATTPLKKEHAGRALIASLVRAQPSDFSGDHGYLLMARANRQIGLLDSAKSLLLAGIQQANLGDLRHRMNYELANCHQEAGEFDLAIILYQTLTHLETELGTRSIAHLAEIAYRQRDDETCIDLCFQLVEHEDYATATLNMLARVYERNGQHQMAAQCYAGHIPHTEQTEPTP